MRSSVLLDLYRYNEDTRDSILSAIGSFGEMVTTPATLKCTGLAMRMVLESGEAANRRQPDVRLIAAIAKAQRWWGRLLEEPDLTVTDLTRTESLAPSYGTRIIRLAFLDPAIVARITEGSTPADLDRQRLTRTNAIPASWQQQRQQIGFCTRRMAD